MKERLDELLDRWAGEVKMRVDLVNSGKLTDVQKVAMLAIAKVIQDKRVELRATMDGVPVPSLTPTKDLRVDSIRIVGGRQ